MRFRCAVSMLLVLYTEKDMSKFLYSLSTGRYQDAKKAGPAGPALDFNLFE